MKYANLLKTSCKFVKKMADGEIEPSTMLAI